ncbi:MAG TPA: class I SAM-dependent methyltransferase [Ktedonobacterales bacterium]
MDSPRASLLGTLFEMLYRNRTLYRLASTIPFAGQWRTWQRLAIPQLAGHDVLEVGCGLGDLLADMAQAGYHCTGVDRSPQMVAATRDTLRHREISPAAGQALQGDVRALPFPAASFDSVVSTFPTSYVTEEAALREVGRVLRPGGRYIIVLNAELLSDSPLLAPLVGFAALVYGRQRTPMCSAGAGSLRGIPWEAGALSPHATCVTGPHWRAYVVIGEKDDRLT